MRALGWKFLPSKSGPIHMDPTQKSYLGWIKNQPPIKLKGMRACLIFLGILLTSEISNAAPNSTFKADLVKPGKTSVAKLKEVLGKPRNVYRVGPTREYHFYDLGEGSTTDATISVKSGVVEYITYLC